MGLHENAKDVLEECMDSGNGEEVESGTMMADGASSPAASASEDEEEQHEEEQAGDDDQWHIIVTADKDANAFPECSLFGFMAFD